MEEFDYESYMALQKETANKKEKPKAKIVREGEVEVQLPDPRYVNRPKSAGQGSSRLGFAHGEVTHQDLED